MTHPEPAEPTGKLPESPAVQRWALITWPAFLAACLLEALVFSMIDPAEVHWLGHELKTSRQAVYTAAFFCFWLIAMASNALVLWMHKPAQTVNSAINDRIAD